MRRFFLVVPRLFALLSSSFASQLLKEQDSGAIRAPSHDVGESDRHAFPSTQQILKFTQQALDFLSEVVEHPEKIKYRTRAVRILLIAVDNISYLERLQESSQDALVQAVLAVLSSTQNAKETTA